MEIINACYFIRFIIIRMVTPLTSKAIVVKCMSYLKL